MNNTSTRWAAGSLALQANFTISPSVFPSPLMCYFRAVYQKFKGKSTVEGELSSRRVEPRTRCLEKNNNWEFDWGALGGSRLSIFQVFVSVFEERRSCLSTPKSHTGNYFPSLITNVWQGRWSRLALINREVPYLAQMCWTRFCKRCSQTNWVTWYYPKCVATNQYCAASCCAPGLFLCPDVCARLLTQVIGFCLQTHFKVNM